MFALQIIVRNVLTVSGVRTKGLGSCRSLLVGILCVVVRNS
jgi:hypothetical protein